MSEPRLLWRLTPFPARAFAVSLLLWLALLGGWRLPWAETAGNFRERRTERAVLSPILAEARREGLTFPQVVVAHPAHLGKPVYWDVTVVSTTTSYAEGRPGWSVVWIDPERAAVDFLHGHGRVLAKVAAVDRDAVYLDYLGRP
ncbi:MAG: hypothetical protein Q8T11_05485 [Elusimicrobiota bacterium]|nr:hypothetical protein [Elusimicrobiota bacterium]